MVETLNGSFAGDLRRMERVGGCIPARLRRIALVWCSVEFQQIADYDSPHRGGAHQQGNCQSLLSVGRHGEKPLVL